MEVDLDTWLPAPAIRTTHRREAAAPPDALWAAARGLRVDATGPLGRLVRWRIPGLPAAVTFAELFSAPPFTVLDEGDGWSVSGLVGRIWTLRRDYPALDGADAFAAWAQPGTARVVFAHWVVPGPDGRSTLFSEARVAPVDRGAALRLRALWAVVGPWERLIGGEALGRAVKSAEAATLERR
ncbi:hypothetical protein DSM104299_01481 [Baekduia alba]|uniref:hypothetical protein n=1 Tax=Baekduia alba TaxID=2997333 RepID=UPI002340873F|nr:hypothetical protein [Baekduia alba]WCB92782.1 hypothetical protein DSM104299_01481 [Baekduia alba]